MGSAPTNIWARCKEASATTIGQIKPACDRNKNAFYTELQIVASMKWNTNNNLEWFFPNLL